jgi:hypothetical protein
MQAINGTDGYAKLTPGTHFLYDGVHLFIASYDGICWAYINAQSASDTPSFINPRNVSRTLLAIKGVQW